MLEQREISRNLINVRSKRKQKRNKNEKEKRREEKKNLWEKRLVVPNGYYVQLNSLNCVNKAANIIKSN